MRRLGLLLAVLLCSQICERLGYDFTVMKPDKKSCFCADKVDKKNPMVIWNFSAKWFVPHAELPSEGDEYE